MAEWRLFNKGQLLRRLGETVVQALYPMCCPFCDRTLTKIELTAGACRNCQIRLVYITSNHCMKCGKPLSDERTEYCYDCSRHTHAFSQARALLSYQGRIPGSLYRFKNGNRREYAAFYGEEICRILGPWISSCRCDYLVPIPLSPGKRGERGYNQSEILGRVISTRMKIPMLTDVLVKEKDTGQQKELSGQQRRAAGRRRELMDAFRVVDVGNSLGLSGKRILLVDDIYTTGSTVDAASRVLLEAGAAGVWVVTVAMGG